jgi:hypothetical protein
MLDSLPNELILFIARFLSAVDALAFSHVSRSIFKVLSTSRKMCREHLAASPLFPVSRCVVGG